jgi:hypothetical protein
MPCLLPVAILASVLLASPPIPAAPPATAPAAAADSPEVRALVQRVTARYGEAKTYRDTGTGSTTLGPGVPATGIEFETAFIRDGGFRWSFQKTGSRPPMPYVVWSPDGRAWNSWWKLKGTTERFDSFRMAVAGPTGISNGLTMIVPDLLRPDGGDSWFFIGLVDRKIRGKEPIDGVECEILEARRSIDGKEFGAVTVWVDASGAIRRYRGTATIDPATMPIPPSLPPEEAERFRARPKFESITEFRFTPTFDGPVPTEDVAFTPPA